MYPVRFLLTNLCNYSFKSYSFLLKSPAVSRKKNLYFYRLFSAQTGIKAKNIKNIDDLLNYINLGKHFYLKLLTNVFHKINFEHVNDKDIRIILDCCGKAVSDSTKDDRNAICQQIYQELLNKNRLNLNILNAYVKICTENDFLIKYNTLLSQVNFEISEETLKLLLENSCKNGAIVQALEILKKIKDQSIPVDETIFNNLIYANILKGGLAQGENVLKTMNLAQIQETNNTKLSILKALIMRSELNEFERALTKYKVKIDDEWQYYSLIECLGLSGNCSWLPKCVKLYDGILSRDFLSAIENLCLHLVHMKKWNCAVQLYLNYISPEHKGRYGNDLLKEMLHCEVPEEFIINFCENLKRNKLNENGLEYITEVALKHKYEKQAWIFLKHFSELRPHYFWPLLLISYSTRGEKGLLESLKNVKNMAVNVNSETLETYVFPFCDLKHPKLLINELKNYGFTVKELLTPLLLTYLKKDGIDLAAEICTEYGNVSISSEQLRQNLIRCWKNTKNSTCIVNILRRYCESNPSLAYDAVGELLIASLDNCKKHQDFVEYLKLVAAIDKVKLRINSSTYDILMESINKHNIAKLRKDICDGIYNLVDLSLHSQPQQVLNLKNMNAEQLECHLTELENKNMQTRGILRLLILEHTKLGNVKRVSELRKKFLSLGYKESSGMKAALLKSFIEIGNIELALEVYNELLKDSSFKLDEHKIIDLATQLVRNGKCEDAIHLVKQYSKKYKVSPQSSFEINIWKLLSSYNEEHHQQDMFNFLIENNFCKPKNTLLGPLVRIHLNSDNKEKAFSKYMEFCKKYKCTPLQLEILVAAIKSKNDQLLQTLISATESAIGNSAAKIGLLSALAECGLENQLSSLIQTIHFKHNLLIKKRCERWVQEKKILPLQTLRRSVQRASTHLIEMDFIHKCILQVYDSKGQYESIIDYYNDLKENYNISNKIELLFREILEKKNMNLIK